MTSVTGASWFLRSTRDADTHYGYQRGDGTVTAACGLRFAPQRRLRAVGAPPRLVDAPPALPGPPPDPGQVCQECARRR